MYHTSKPQECTVDLFSNPHGGCTLCRDKKFSCSLQTHYESPGKPSFEKEFKNIVVYLSKIYHNDLFTDATSELQPPKVPDAWKLAIKAAWFLRQEVILDDDTIARINNEIANSMMVIPHRCIRDTEVVEGGQRNKRKDKGKGKELESVEEMVPGSQEGEENMEIDHKGEVQAISPEILPQGMPAQDDKSLDVVLENIANSFL